MKYYGGKLGSVMANIHPEVGMGDPVLPCHIGDMQDENRVRIRVDHGSLTNINIPDSLINTPNMHIKSLIKVLCWRVL